MVFIYQLCKEASQRSTVKVELCGDHDLTATSKAIKYTNIVKAKHASYGFMHTPRRFACDMCCVACRCCVRSAYATNTISAFAIKQPEHSPPEHRLVQFGRPVMNQLQFQICKCFIQSCLGTQDV